MSRLRWIGLGVLASLCACGDDASGDTESSAESSSGSTSASPGTSGGPDPSGSPAEETSTTSNGGAEGSDPTPGGNSLPQGDGCCEAHEGPSCDEAAVVACVCDLDPACCVFDWLESCAAMAENACEATCEPDETSSESGSGAGGNACREPVVIQLGAAQAQLSGSWELSTSQSGEGQIVVLDQSGTDGEVLWTIDVPCDDTWTIWVRLFDQGQNDSFFATLDGEPQPPAIFEGGIPGPGQGWTWQPLNWRDPDDASMFIEDPWTPEWIEGSHALALSYREAFAVARIEVTNDPTYMP